MTPRLVLLLFAAKLLFGQADFQGYWTNVTITPLERPVELAGKAVLTAEEAAKYEKETNRRNNADVRDSSAEVDVSHGYNQFWYDRGTKLVNGYRTSLIVDPPDGRIPPLTPAAQKRMTERQAEVRQHSTDGPEYRSLQERCINWPVAGPPMLPTGYNSNYQILQTPKSVVILIEMIHDARIIPLDGRPHVASGIREWMGDPRGHWEGHTLVVDSTNFTDKSRFRGSDENLHLTERFTRVSPDTLLYEFTVDDPTAFTKPWTAQIPMTKAKGPIYEYACHEGNYAMMDILAGARAAEKKAKDPK